MSMLDDIRFWVQVIRDSKRTVMCSPEMESRVKTMLAANGWDHLITVKVNRAVPDDQVFIVDEQAIRAEASKPIRWRASWVRPEDGK